MPTLLLYWVKQNGRPRFFSPFVFSTPGPINFMKIISLDFSEVSRYIASVPEP
jgi:hypothetical protein